MCENKLELLKPFPPGNRDLGEATNPAIRLYGRRFYENQTPVEYLAEFLLVFASGKGADAEYPFSFCVKNGSKPIYWPEDRVALKIFSFFPSSKLETRHPVHSDEYIKILKIVENNIISEGNIDRIEVVRTLQSLFAGFVGISQNRTWVTHTFLPVSKNMLAREVTWNHQKALKNKGNIENWEQSKKYFDSSTHNFLGRGGELLFLQLANLFSNRLPYMVNSIFDFDCYSHIDTKRFIGLCKKIESGLKQILDDAVGVVNDLVDFVEYSLSDYNLAQCEGGNIKNSGRTPTKLGWVSTASRYEALLFAVEIENICDSTLGPLEKIELLQFLCVMQVLRSLCFQAVRFDGSEKTTEGFIGNYAWIMCRVDADTKDTLRKAAQGSTNKIMEILFRVLRSPILGDDGEMADAKSLKNGDANCLGHFRRLTKQIGLVVPRTGSGERFVLPPHLLRFLVAALLRPGERVRLTEFYARVFAHYGIALGERQLATALAWTNSYQTDKDYAISADTTWIEEALRQGGFLMELSDAVSIVHNPGRAEY